MLWTIYSKQRDFLSCFVYTAVHWLDDQKIKLHLQACCSWVRGINWTLIPTFPGVNLEWKATGGDWSPDVGLEIKVNTAADSNEIRISKIPVFFPVYNRVLYPS